MLWRCFSLAFLWVAVSTTGSAEELSVGGRTLYVQTRAGFCALEKSIELDAFVLKIAADMQRGVNEVIALWVDCEQLSAYRNGEVDQFTSYVLLLAQLSKQGKIVPFDVSLHQYLEEMKRVIADTNGFAASMQDIQNEQRERLAKVLSDLGADSESMRITDPQVFWLIAEDAAAIYHGIIQKYKVNGRDTLVGTVFAMTELNGLAITINAYEAYQGATTFDVLQVRVSSIVANLVAMNPTTP